MFPVIAMCGHRCGLHMTATTAMPDAVLTGLHFSFGKSDFLCVFGTAAMISVRRGCDRHLCFLEMSDFTACITRAKEHIPTIVVECRGCSRPSNCAGRRRRFKCWVGCTESSKGVFFRPGEKSKNQIKQLVSHCWVGRCGCWGCVGCRHKDGVRVFSLPEQTTTYVC